jgi:hypothetical protein
MLELERCCGSVADARQDREGDQGPVADFDFSGRRHLADDMSDLLKRRNALLAPRLGHSTDGHNQFAQSHSRYKIHRRNQGRQTASSSRRLISSVTKIRRQLDRKPVHETRNDNG